MHTFEGKSCRIYFNSDMSGDMYIFNKSSTKKMVVAAQDILDFVRSYSNSNEESMKEDEIISKLPLLKTYPIGLKDDIYTEDEECVYRWEVETIKRLLNNLCNKYKGKHITPDVYADFFNKEVQPYAEYFINDYDIDGEIYEKILPKNISIYWSYRIDRTLSWSESWNSDNVGISVISFLENDYLDKSKHIEDYTHLIGSDDTDL